MPKANHLEYGEKKTRTTLSLSPTAIQKLGEMAESLGMSSSGFIEEIARGNIENFTQARSKALGEFSAN
jgi:hypothetical protein